MSSSSSQSSDADSDGFNEDEIERLLDLKRAELAELEQAKGGEEESDNDQDKEAAAKDADPSSSLARGLEPTPIMESVDNSLAPQGAPLDLEEEEEVDVYDLLERVDNGQHRLPPRKMKRVLVHRGVDHFDPLPNGWVEVTHDCGLPVFLHKQSRVATFAKPYFLDNLLQHSFPGPASVRNHTVPGSAIPCYHARKLRAARAELELAGSSTSIMTDVKEEPQENGGVERSDGGALAENTPLLRTPKIKLQSASEVARTQLNADDIFAYAKDLFEFTEICVYKFRNWTDTRRFGQEKAKKQVELAGSTPRPGLPKNVRLLTIPSAERMAKPHQRALYLTLHDGKSSISILHEYSQKVLKCVVEYGYTETRNSAMPYHAVVRAKVNRKSVDAIGDLSVKEKIRHLLSAKPSDIDANPMAATEEDTLVLGEGDGNSKKVAKLMAAKAAVGSLLPGVTFDNDGLLLTANGAGHDDGKDEEDGQAADQCAGEDDAYALFDQCAITDTRVPDLSFKTGQPSPYITLQEILKRSVAFCDLELRPMQSRRLRHQQHLFELGVGEYTAKVVASNKRDGKQKAAQELIRRLLPEMKNWGSILRVYGQESKMKQREIRKSQESVIKLQDEARKQNETGQGSFEPNKAILDKLRGEMMKLSRNLNGSDTTQQDASHLGNAKKRRLGADPIEEEIFVRPLKLSITQTPTFDIDTQ